MAGGFVRRTTATALLWVLAVSAFAQPPRTEREIKALFFVTLARYVEWPASGFSSDADPIVIGILGQDPFGTFLDTLIEKEAVRGRPIRIRRFASVDEVKSCHLLYLAPMSPALFELSLSRLKGRPILTVSDTPKFAERGGVVELFLNEESKVRLRISKSALASVGLSVSPALLRLAQMVASLEIVVDWENALSLLKARAPLHCSGGGNPPKDSALC